MDDGDELVRHLCFNMNDAVDMTSTDSLLEFYLATNSLKLPSRFCQNKSNSVMASAGIPSALWHGHADINSSSFYATDASNNMFPIINSDNFNDPLTNLVDPSLSTYTDKELGVDVIADKNVLSEPVSELAQENITSKPEKPRKRTENSNEVENTKHALLK
ncbi:hypothetical protein AAHE18_08G163600 [Arachis hypogaea]